MEIRAPLRVKESESVAVPSALSIITLQSRASENLIESTLELNKKPMCKKSSTDRFFTKMY